jgi:hypothetical protein
MTKKKSAASDQLATNDQPPATNSLVTDPAGADVDADTNPDAETDALEETLLQAAITHHGITDADLFAYRIDLQARAVVIVTVDARKLFYPPL